MEKYIHPSIVRIETDQGRGTGFVLARSAEGILIATNYHVVRGGSKFDAVFESGARLGNIEVAKIDIEHDLALLKAMSPGGNIQGLVLSSEPCVVGQTVGASGYPFVAGESEPSYSFEYGSVTNLTTEIEGHKYIRTNVNINPGNSGGPVVNGCGQVVGVVVAIHTQTQRTALIVPGEQLATLIAAFDAPRGTPEAEITTRVGALEKAVRYARGVEVAEMLSRHMLYDVATAAFLKLLEESMANGVARVNAFLNEKAAAGEPIMVEGNVITDFNALPADLRPKLIEVALSEGERTTYTLGVLLAQEEIDVHTAMLSWLGTFAHQQFGETPSFKVDAIESTGPSSARSDLAIQTAGAQTFWVFDWVYEWGDWRINGYSCVRGCQ